MLVGYLSGAIAFMLLFFSGVLLFKRSPLQRVNRYLIVAGICVAVHHLICIHQLSCHTHAMCMGPAYYFPLHLLGALPVAPALYCFLLAFTNGRDSCCKCFCYNLITLLPVALYLMWFMHLSPHRQAGVLAGGSAVDVMVLLFNLQFYIQSVIYLALCWRLVYRQKSAGYLLEVDRRFYHIRWVAVFIFLLIAGLSIYLVYGLMTRFDGSSRRVGLVMIDLLVLGLYLYIFLHNKVTLHECTKAKVSELSEGEAAKALQLLQQVAESTACYLSADCSLKTVAGYCDCSQHQLSHLLNICLQTSFTDYINGYRIRYACQLLSDNAIVQQMTLETLGLKCGFGSKASFYRAFKKHTGITPCEYAKSGIRDQEPGIRYK